MNFESILMQLVSRVDGARGAIFLEAAGEAVGWYTLKDPDQLRLRAAYLAVLVQTWRTCSTRPRMGATIRLIVQYAGADFIIEDLQEGYFVALELESGSNLAEAVKHIQPAVAGLRREMAA